MLTAAGRSARLTSSDQDGLPLSEPGRADVAVSGPHDSSSLSGPTWANTQTLAQEPGYLGRGQNDHAQQRALSPSGRWSCALSKNQDKRDRLEHGALNKHYFADLSTTHTGLCAQAASKPKTFLTTYCGQRSLQRVKTAGKSLWGVLRPSQHTNPAKANSYGYLL